jgi:WD40 repeat protein/energy-coupling factor transporter ATP-binding protein EcfA2
MTDKAKIEGNAQADNSSIAVGKIEVGGDVQGNITIGNSNTIGYSANEVSVLLQKISASFQAKPFDGRCPYKGLDVFEEEDAELFFGREKLVDDLVSRVKDSRTVFVTGPSGSGKSSLVRAGLIHALKQGQVKGSDRWLYATMKPGRDPIGELGRVVSSLASSTNPEDEIRAKAMTDATIFERWCEIVLKEGRDKRLVLFIDQFEEVFTQINKEEERVAFLNLLTHAATIESGRVIILFSMRSDFVSNCATYPQLNALLNQQFVQIGAMQPEELVSAIAQPALRVGLRIDPDLIAQIINEMKGEPGALPLMQFALKDLFDFQQEKSGVIDLTLNDYLQRGGIHKALERHADDSFAKLSKDEQELARSIFSGLIEIGRGTQDTKRTALFDELVPANTKAEEVEAIVQKLADARLITTDEAAGKDTVTISHEKLIDAWPWLKKLVNENRDVIALQNQITTDAKEWEEHQRDNSYLYSGGRLANIWEQVQKQKLALGQLAQEFVKAGRRRQQQARVVLISAISLVLIASIVASVVFQNQAQANKEIAQTAEAAKSEAISQKETAQAYAEEVQRQSNIARSRALAIISSADPSTVQKNLLLSIESLDLVKEYSDSDRAVAEESFRRAFAEIGGIPLVGHESYITALVFSPDGKWLATGSNDNTARLWDMRDPSVDPIVLKGHESYISTLAFSSDGNWLATGSANNILTGSQDSTARLWDMRDLSAEPVILEGHENSIFALAFSPNGNWLATGSIDNTTRLWNVRDLSAQPIVLDEDSQYITTIAFSSDGNWLATADGVFGGVIHLWDLQNTSAPPLLISGHVPFAFGPDGNWLAIGTVEGVVRLLDMHNPFEEPIILEGHDGYISTLAFSADGNWLATGSADNTARLWNLYDISAPPIVLDGHENVISTLAFSLDGNWLATGSKDSTVRLWSVKNPSLSSIVLRGHTDYITSLAFSPDGNWLATGSNDNTTRLWSVVDSSAQPIVLKGHETDITSLTFSPNGNWLAITGFFDNTVRLWDVSDPKLPSYLSIFDIEDTLKEACSVVGRNFTRAEWAQYFPNEEYRKTCEQWPLKPEATVTPTATP